MRRRVVYVVVSVFAVAVLATILWRPGGPLARPGGPAPPPEAGDDAPNRAEDGMKGENQAANLPRATGEGGEVLPFRLDGHVKVFEITARRVQWEVTPGKWIEAWTYNGTVPGPTIRVRQGDTIRVNFRNELPEATAIHWHGIKLPWGQDGVPGLTMDAVEPGKTFTYEFKVDPAGTHWYHTHFNTSNQITSGLYGAFVVDPPTGKTAAYDRDYTVMIGDAGALGLTMNGHGYPRSRPLNVRQGERVLLRLVNAGAGPHPMHLHGHVMEIVAKDGAPMHVPIHADTVHIAPGETFDLAFTADNPGAWIFHCHIPAHAEGPTGMFGLTQEVRYLDVPGLPPEGAAASHGGNH